MDDTNVSARAAGSASIGWRFTALAFLAALTLLLAACSVTIEPAAVSSPTANGSVTIPVQVKQGDNDATLVTVPVTIQGQGPFNFVIDTGASVSLIDQPIARQLGLAAAGAPQSIAGIGGVSQATPVHVSDWHMDRINLPTITAVSANLISSARHVGAQGLIGSDIWRRFGTISINFAAQTLTVPRQIAAARAPAPVTVGRAGLAVPRGAVAGRPEGRARRVARTHSR